MTTLIENKWATIEDKFETDIPPEISLIYDYFSEAEENQDPNIFRASAAPSCVRQLWFRNNNYTPKPMPPRRLMNFNFGDLVELWFLAIIKKSLVGPGKLYSEIDCGQLVAQLPFKNLDLCTYNQEAIHTKINDFNFVSHPDAWGKRNSDGKWELVEIKSTSTFGYRSFKSGTIDYLPQAMICLASDKANELGASEVRYFYLRKETTHIWSALRAFDATLFEQTIQKFKEATSDMLPFDPYPLIEEVKNKKRSGRLIAQSFPCGYCNFLTQCKGEHLREYSNDQFSFSAPKFIFQKNLQTT